MTIKRKYSELEHQLRGLRLATGNIYTGIINDDPRMIAAEINYFDEKQRRVKTLMQELIDQDRNNDK